MKLDAAFLVTYSAVFIRISAMMLTAPLFSGMGTPVLVRVFMGAAIACAVSPVVYGSISVPEDLLQLGLLVGREAITGMAIGFCIQLALSAAQMAGSFLDVAVGFGMASVLAPNTSLPSTILSKFKTLLAIALFLALNGHHIMMKALVGSYSFTGSLTAESGMTAMLSGLGSMSLLALQIALPVAAVTFVVDAALGIVNKAVPQINVLMAGISAKLLAGLVALALSLPALAYGVSQGLTIASDLIGKAFGS